MRITQKGQVTIPADIREHLGLLPDTEVVFRIEDEHVVLEKVTGEARRGRQVVDRLRGQANQTMSTDEILALSRGDE